MLAAEEQRNSGQLQIFSLFLLQRIVLFLLQIASERSKSCSRSNKDDFAPSVYICESRFFKFGFEEFRFRQKVFRNKTVFNDASSHDYILLCSGVGSDGEESGSYGIGQFHKILEGKFDMMLLDYSDKVIPLTFVLSLCDSSELVSGF